MLLICPVCCIIFTAISRNRKKKPHKDQTKNHRLKKIIEKKQNNHKIHRKKKIEKNEGKNKKIREKRKKSKRKENT
jgi:formate hydrogenlyase subunit 6/NADH:ubiquinone oxidoreductase subunit I